MRTDHPVPLPLPRSSPELNPAEQLFRVLRPKVTNRRAGDDVAFGRHTRHAKANARTLAEVVHAGAAIAA
jgi:hypothetical protein